MVSRQFLGFVIAGGTAAALNFGSRLLLSTAMPYVPAIVLAYIVGMLTAFILNRRFVFRDADSRLHHQALWFIAINLGAVAQTLAVSIGLARWLFPAAGLYWHAETLAHGIGVAVPVITSYIGHKRYTFRGTNTPS